MRAFARVLMLLLAAGAVTGGAAWGEPRNGFGLAGGVTANEGTRTPQGGTTEYAHSTGLSIAGDAQFTINERWSLVPYLALSWENSTGDQTGIANNGGAGFEVRRWWGDLFVGGRIGYYVELLATEHINGTGYGPGAGVSVGTERAGSLTWGATAELFRVGVWGNHASIRLHVGRRWD